MPIDKLGRNEWIIVQHALQGHPDAEAAIKRLVHHGISGALRSAVAVNHDRDVLIRAVERRIQADLSNMRGKPSIPALAGIYTREELNNPSPAHEPKPVAVAPVKQPTKKTPRKTAAAASRKDAAPKNRSEEMRQLAQERSWTLPDYYYHSPAAPSRDKLLDSLSILHDEAQKLSFDLDFSSHNVWNLVHKFRKEDALRSALQRLVQRQSRKKE